MVLESKIFKVTKRNNRVAGTIDTLYLPYYENLAEKTYNIDWHKDYKLEFLSQFSIKMSRGDFKVIVTGDFVFEKDEVKELINLTNITFMGKFKIVDTIFEKKISFRNCNFLGKFAFYFNVIETKLFFNDSYFNNVFYFNDNQVENLVFSNIKFTSSQDKLLDSSQQILNHYSAIMHNIKEESVAHFRQSCNFIKNHYMSQNNYIDSNIFYALEMLARSKELNPRQAPLEWLFFKLNEITSNHGQSIAWPMLFIFGLACLWGVANYNMDYFIGIANPFSQLLDSGKSTSSLHDWLKPFYLLSKIASAVLWWQLIRAIRKDIKR